MTRTIQNTRTRSFVAHAAELYGMPVSPATLDTVGELDELDDLAALRVAFPSLSDAEVHEALWALGHFDG